MFCGVKEVVSQLPFSPRLFGLVCLYDKFAPFQNKVRYIKRKKCAAYTESDERPLVGWEPLGRRQRQHGGRTIDAANMATSSGRHCFAAAHSSYPGDSLIINSSYRYCSFGIRYHFSEENKRSFFMSYLYFQFYWWPIMCW